MSNEHKLTNHSRDQIITNATRDAFKDETLAVKKRMARFAMKCYRTVVSAAQEKQARQAPEEWLDLTNVLRLDFYSVPTEEKPSSWHLDSERNVEVEKAVPFRANSSTGQIRIQDVDMHREYKEIVAVRDEIGEKREALEDSIRQMVYSTASLKKLITMWPEVVGFLPPYLTEPKPQPIVPVATQVNAALKAAGIKVGVIVAPKTTGGLVAVAA